MVQQKSFCYLGALKFTLTILQSSLPEEETLWTLCQSYPYIVYPHLNPLPQQYVSSVYSVHDPPIVLVTSEAGMACFQ